MSPGATLRAVVVVPARDEEQRIGACLEALAAQEGVAAEEFELVIVLDACADATADVVDAVEGGPRIHVAEGPGRGAGIARRLGMDHALALLDERGGPRSLIATTDADTRVAPGWLAGQISVVATGAEAIGGRIDLDPEESRRLSRAGLAARDDDLAARLRSLRATDARAEHPHFAGASIGLTRDAYRRVGGMSPVRALEDEDLERRLTDAGIPIARPASVRVQTSARTGGRAGRGLANDLAVREWLESRSYDGHELTTPGEPTAPAPERSISVILPAREVAETIGPIIEGLVPYREHGVVGQILVVDAGSGDGTASVASASGADVVQEDELLTRFGPCRGKGDAMWRAAAVADGELLAFMDADTRDPDPMFLARLLAPALADPSLELVKGTFGRPFDAGRRIEGEGGRVTELTARPLINLHFPELRGFAQPLAGEMVVTRRLFSRLSVPVGYGVEIAMLIDAVAEVGLDAVAQVDLGERQNRHQSLSALSVMAFQVATAVERRIRDESFELPRRFTPRPDSGLATVEAGTEERPPLASLGPERELDGRSVVARA